MSSRQKSSNWLEQVARLLNGSRKARRPRMRRRLLAERLERRMVLSVAPATDGSSESFAQDDGSVAVESDATFRAEDENHAQSTTESALSDPQSTDAYFTSYSGSGEG